MPPWQYRRTARAGDRPVDVSRSMCQDRYINQRGYAPAPMTLSTQTRYTPDEYRQLEARAQQRHEYRDGEIVPMPGGSLEHSRICGNIFAYLKFLLRDTQFEPINSDLRLWVPAYNRGLYPDVMVFDGAPTLNGDRNDEVLDPIAIVEVLSPSTQAFDREDKFLFYRSIPNFCEYILVRQTVPVSIAIRARSRVGGCRSFRVGRRVYRSSRSGWICRWRRFIEV